MNSGLWFLCGQLGLGLGAVSCIGIMHLLSLLPNRPSWYFFLVVWGMGLTAIFLMSYPYLLPDATRIPEIANWFRIAFGIERAVVWFSVAQGERRKQAPTSVIQLGNYVLGLMLVGAICWTLYGAILENRAEMVQLSQKIDKKGVTRATETALQARYDSLQVQFAQSQQQVANLEDKLNEAGKQLSVTNQQLSDLVDIVISLKRAINRLGVSVERDRNSRIDNNPIRLLPPKTPTGQISPDKVQPVPTPPLRKGRKSAAVFDLETESEWVRVP